jgi:hypothetical protein
LQFWQQHFDASAESSPAGASIPAPVEVIEGIIKADEETRLY